MENTKIKTTVGIGKFDAVPEELSMLSSTNQLKVQSKCNKMT